MRGVCAGGVVTEKFQTLQGIGGLFPFSLALADLHCRKVVKNLCPSDTIPVSAEGGNIWEEFDESPASWIL